jgi:hypothetical protein
VRPDYRAADPHHLRPLFASLIRTCCPALQHLIIILCTARAGVHNDLRGTMDQLHQALNALHTAVRNSSPIASPPRFLQSPPSPSTAARMVQPFAIVQNVEPNSPAEEGGMKMGDKLVKFGDAQGPAGLTVLQSRLSVCVLQRAEEISV